MRAGQLLIALTSNPVGVSKIPILTGALSLASFITCSWIFLPVGDISPDPKRRIKPGLINLLVSFRAESRNLDNPNFVEEIPPRSASGRIGRDDFNRSFFLREGRKPRLPRYNPRPQFVAAHYLLRQIFSGCVVLPVFAVSFLFHWAHLSQRHKYPKYCSTPTAKFHHKPLVDHICLLTGYWF